MMNKINRLFLMLFVCLAFSASALAQDKLPSIELNNTKGEKVNIADYGKKDKLVVLSFWATWCVPCRKELDNIADVYADWKEKYNLEVVAISVDDQRTVSRVAAYAQGKGWEYEVLLDTKEDLKRALNGLEVPYTVVVNPKGEIVFKHSGYVEGDEFELEKKIQEILAEKK
ncbi:MAG: TlpA family protein disulfide reductase [Chitinophagales bacterium]|jgi:peroxiredoxin|nr:TlpA family protein disulfide reductase [Chitinophagales bacterium]